MALVLRGARAAGVLKQVATAPLAQANAARGFSVTTAGRAGMGSPVPAHEPPTGPLMEESELKWDCGDAYPEPALDEVPAKIVGRNEAGLMLGGALVVMAGVYNFAKWVDKPATQPFADKTFPFDGLKAELGGE